MQQHEEIVKVFVLSMGDCPTGQSAIKDTIPFPMVCFNVGLLHCEMVEAGGLADISSAAEADRMQLG